MTDAIALIILLLSNIAGVVTVVKRFVPRKTHAQVCRARADQAAIATRLLDEVDRARQRELSAIAVADERRAEAAELRAQLERRAAEAFVGHRVVVQTKDGHTIDGMLVEVYADHYRLEAAKYLVNGNTTVLAGDELVPIENVSWIQRPGADDAGDGGGQ